MLRWIKEWKKKIKEKNVKVMEWMCFIILLIMNKNLYPPFEMGAEAKP